VDGKGAPVIGIAGSQSEEHVHALALVFIRDGAPAAPAPVLPPLPPPAPPRPEEPPVLPPDVLKRVPPVEPPPQEPDDAPPAKEPEPIPPADARKADAPAKGANWLPYVIFGAVTIPVFLLLAFSFTRRSQVADHRPGKPKRPAARSPTPRSTASSTGIRERPGPGAKRPSRPANDGIFDELSALLDPPKKVEEEEEPEEPVSRQGLEISLHEFQMTSRRPWWVRLGLWKIHDRLTAGVFLWASLMIAVIGAIGGIQEPRLLLCLAALPAALWYWLCIRWVYQHDRWV
jgi:hypothetical protein